MISDGLVGSVLPGRHSRTRIREVRLIRIRKSKRPGGES